MEQRSEAGGIFGSAAEHLYYQVFEIEEDLRALLAVDPSDTAQRDDESADD